jgi:toxin ParE1/3/4
LSAPSFFLRERARDDVAEILEYLAPRSPQAARAFVAALHLQLEKLSEKPSLGRLWRPRVKQLAGMRYSRIRRFRSYLVFYLVTEQGLDVIRVLHGARRLGPLLRRQ